MFCLKTSNLHTKTVFRKEGQKEQPLDDRFSGRRNEIPTPEITHNNWFPGLLDVDTRRSGISYQKVCSIIGVFRPKFCGRNSGILFSSPHKFFPKW